MADTFEPDFENRIVSSSFTQDDARGADSENTLRPKTLYEYVGQSAVMENLSVSF